MVGRKGLSVPHPSTTTAQPLTLGTFRRVESSRIPIPLRGEVFDRSEYERGMGNLINIVQDIGGVGHLKRDRCKVVVKQKTGVHTGGEKGEHAKVNLGCIF